MKKLFALSLVFMLVFGFDCVMCNYRIRTLEQKVSLLKDTNLLKDSLINVQDSLLVKYRK